MNKAILAHLSRKDPVLGGLIRAVGPRRLAPPEDCHPFQVLAQAIAHQQLNGTAANTILKRLVDGCGQGAFPTPHLVIAAPEETLRAAGFSRAKVAALKDLAAFGERWKPYRTTAAWYLWRAMGLKRAGTLPEPAERIRLPRIPRRRRSARASRRLPAGKARARAKPATRQSSKGAASSSARPRRSGGRTR